MTDLLLNKEAKRLIARGKNTLIYHLAAEDGRSDHALKVLAHPSPNEQEVGQLENEYLLTKDLPIRQVRKAVYFDRSEDQPFLVLEYINGKTLADLIKDQPLLVPDFLPLAIEVVEVLESIHRHQIIHRDISSSNIMVVDQLQSVKFIDFGTSVRTSQKITLSREEAIEGTLPYISPELTGRISHGVDHRTDIYSLGITFYELLTGQLPFNSDDPVEMIHLHLAKQPLPLRKYRASIPPAIEQIVLKMMAKNPDERYQTARGVWHDLKYCLQNINDLQTIHFEPGLKDISGYLVLPDKVFGRKKELEILAEMYGSVKQPRLTAAWIVGEEGVGKTSLLNVFHKAHAYSDCWWVEGRFAKNLQNLPYTGWQQVLQQITEKIISQDSVAVEQLGGKLKSAVGSNGRILTDLCPSISVIIGPQPSLMKMNAEETKNRFQFTIQQFIWSLAKEYGPLVLVLDNTQWADPSSLELFRFLANSADDKVPLFLLAAHRQHQSIEVNSQVPEAVSTIHLKTLSPGVIKSLLAETLGVDRSAERLKQLASIVYRKTRGNPHFLKGFLEEIHQDHILYFDHQSMGWNWVLEKIEDFQNTENVVKLLVRKSGLLSTESKELLYLASCLGGKFTFQHLTEITGKPEAELLDLLKPSLFEGILRQASFHFSFAHEEVRKSIYRGMPEEKRLEFHLLVGSKLFEQIDMTDPGQEITALTLLHLNKAIALVKDPKQQLDFAHLNLYAALNARENSAFAVAHDFLKAGMGLYQPFFWEEDYFFTLSLFAEAAEAAYLTGNDEEMDFYTSAIMKNGRSVLDKIKAFEIRIQAHTSRNRPKSAVKTAIEALSLLGIDFPASQSKFRLLLSWWKTRWFFPIRKAARFAPAKPMTDPHKKAIIRIIYKVGSAVYLTSPDLLPLFIFKSLQVIGRYGHTPEITFIEASYGIVLAALGKLEKNHRLMQATLQMINSQTESKYRCRALMMVHSFHTHWHQKLSTTLLPLKEAIRLGQESGDYEFAAYSIRSYLALSFFMGQPLQQLSEEAESMTATVRQLNQKLVLEMVEAWNSTFHSLLTPETKELTDVLNEFEKWADTTPMNGESRQRTFYILFMRMLLGTFSGEYDRAWENAIACEKYLLTVKGTYDYCFFRFNEALLACKQMEKAASPRVFQDIIESYIKEAHKWVEYAPENHRYLLALVQAELARTKKNWVEAHMYYDQSIRQARENKFLHIEALALEFASNAYREQNRNELAEFFLRKAYNAFYRWGFMAKLAAFEREYPDIIAPVEQPSGHYSTTKKYQLLDISAITKATLTMAEEVVFDQLLIKMTRIMMENAGADHAVLLLNVNGKLTIRAFGGLEEGISVTWKRLEDSSGILPLSVVNYVSRSHNQLILDNSSEDKRFADDAYFQRSDLKGRSVFCFPVIHKGSFQGIYYLENSYVTNAFTPDKLEVIEILTTQTAISIENALLYETLENKVKVRTEELAKKNESITDSINYARQIQFAMLPKVDEMRKGLGELFTLYMPRDIVSGDFYWYSEVGGKVIVIAADCTGHGIPGALMSMVGAGFLNQIVNLQGITQPDEILNQLHVEVRKALKQDTTPNRDGMDIAVCVIDHEKREINFSGAKLPIVLIRRGELTVIKGDRVPIGGYQVEKERKFSCHRISLPEKEKTMIYLFSDGYQDQFGGPQGKKYMIKRLKKTLLEVYRLPMPRQKTFLENTINQWMVDQLQVDDIMMLGFRL